MPTTNSPKQDVIPVRVTPVMRRQVDELTAAGFGTQTDVIRTAVDRMYQRYQQETRNMNSTITQIWQHSTSGDRFAVKVYDNDNPREVWGPLSGEQIENVIRTVRTGGDWEGSYEELLTTQGYDAAEQMIAAFAETADEYRTTWTEA